MLFKYQPNEGAIFFFLFPYDKMMKPKKTAPRSPEWGEEGESVV